ncbi:MAG: hypothetical protein H6797_04225 [Candidatus Nomurabacteria bacterium]|nr:MAG: hypothetical protein H6797_04225 [Candidatus Nomurabacteria bacterium]
MQKQVARKIIRISWIAFGLALALWQLDPTNQFVIDVVTKFGLFAFFTLVGATIAVNVRSQSDKKDPEYASAPPLPTIGTAIQKSFMYVIIPGILLTVIFFAVAYALGWRP